MMRAVFSGGKFNLSGLLGLELSSRSRRLTGCVHAGEFLPGGALAWDGGFKVVVHWGKKRRNGIRPDWLNTI